MCKLKNIMLYATIQLLRQTGVYFYPIGVYKIALESGELDYFSQTHSFDIPIGQILCSNGILNT